MKWIVFGLADLIELNMPLQDFQNYISDLSSLLVKAFEKPSIPTTLDPIITKLFYIPAIILHGSISVFDKKFLAEFSITVWKSLSLWIFKNNENVDDLITEIMALLSYQNLHRFNDGEIMKFWISSTIIGKKNPRLKWSVLKFLNGLPRLFKEDEYDDVALLDPLHVLDLKSRKKQRFFEPFSLLETIVTLIENDDLDEELIDTRKTLTVLEVILDNLNAQKSSAALTNIGILESFFNKTTLEEISKSRKPRLFSTKPLDQIIGRAMTIRTSLQSNISTDFEMIEVLANDLIHVMALNPTANWNQISEISSSLIMSSLEQDGSMIRENRSILITLIKVQFLRLSFKSSYS